MGILGFIVLRHVNNAQTNSYWIRCYNSIRQFYPDADILIIDDNSNPSFITNEDLYKTTVINSEFPKRGELLPYYYYLKNKLFDTAVIIHDSVFIQQKIDLDVDKYKMIWTFGHEWDETENESKMIEIFNNHELTEFFNDKESWKGCFGGMSIITHDFLTHINNKYEISKLLDCITSRYDRSRFERVIGCLLQKECNAEPLLGNIHAYCPWGISIHHADHYKHLPFLKVWTGR
jgi:hypothetical protein